MEKHYARNSGFVRESSCTPGVRVNIAPANLAKMWITFRNLTAVDEPFLWEMLYQAVFVPDGAEPLSRSIIESDELRRYVEDWGAEGDQGVLARVGDNSVGALWLRCFSEDRPGYGFADASTPELSMAILPEFRGRGIGTSMLKLVTERADHDGVAISLSVSTDNRARELYGRFGFTSLRSNGDSLIMLRRPTV